MTKKLITEKQEQKNTRSKNKILETKIIILKNNI